MFKQDKMIDICQKFTSKVNININNIYFLYGGKKINFELTFKEIVNPIDDEKNEMNILVYETAFKSEGIICPKCGYIYNINFELQIIDKLNNSNSNQNNILKGQIINIIKDINNHNETNNIINQLNNIIIMIEHVIGDINKNTEEFKQL